MTIIYKILFLAISSLAVFTFKAQSNDWELYRSIDGVELFTMEPMLPESPCACDKNLTWVSRSDDTEEIVAKRLAEFHVESKSILDFYESRDRLIRFVPYLGVDDLPKLVDVIRDKLVQ